MLDGEATVKVFRQRDGHTWLLPRNTAFEPIVGDQAEVLGKVVAVLRAVWTATACAEPATQRHADRLTGTPRAVGRRPPARALPVGWSA